MKAGYIQYDVKRDPDENMKTIESFLKSGDFELAVLPELCLNGYLFESREALMETAEEVPSGRSVVKMAELSEKYRCAIIFGMAEMENDRIYNTAVMVKCGKYVGKYRKIHLSDFEKRFFDRGKENGVFRTDGVKIGVQICFDLWFPEISREQVRGGADILCALANFGGEQTYEIAKIRAMENLTPLVMCNRTGSERAGDIDADFLGKSSVIDRDGNRISVAKSGKNLASCCELPVGAKKSNVICRDFEEEMAAHYR